MVKAREKYLFGMVHSKGEYLGDGYHIYLIDENDGVRYRCDCGDMGSFEIARLDTSEEYNLGLDDWEQKDETWYLYDGNYSEDFPGLKIDKAIEFLKRRLLINKK